MREPSGSRREWVNDDKTTDQARYRLWRCRFRARDRRARERRTGGRRGSFCPNPRRRRCATAAVDHCRDRLLRQLNLPVLWLLR
jgi:hypothetical protein